ncbi:MAG: preprotein translocase subunit SecG, partial [Candidatus Levybacteria bacterium]|nr:preprotein translocase subunit SecG [Candidatus Levybacteria bacterium]
LTIVIILQSKGTGLSATFGGQGTFYSSRRGVEKLLLFITIILATAFCTIALISIMIP